jgi:signal transduction histidine kinase
LNWVFGVLCASIAIYVFVGVYALFVWSREATGREQGLFAAATFSQLAFAVSRALAVTQRSVQSERFTVGCLAVGLALMVHHSIRYAIKDHLRKWYTAAYAIAATTVALDLGGLTQDETVISGAGSSMGLFQLSLTPVGIVCFAALLALMGLTTYRMGLRYLEGDTDLLPATAGLFLLFVAVGHELAVHARLLPGPTIGQIGLFAFTCGHAGTYGIRYTTVAKELESRTQELEHATVELRKSYRDLRETQEELVRKEQLAAVGELAAVVAHEVRNPLAIITNAVAGLRKPTLTREDQTTLLAIVDEETYRLNRLVLDLLRYARPVALQKQSIALEALIDRALKVARTGGKDIEVSTKFDVDNSTISGDANLLRQVFDNLVENAVQAMSYGGALTIHVERKQGDGIDGVAVHIRDTGEGMDTTVRLRARDPFFTTRPSGTGLGLAIVGRIVEAHGGHLLIESRSGIGTTVTVCLPYEAITSPGLS